MEIHSRFVFLRGTYPDVRGGTLKRSKDALEPDLHYIWTLQRCGTQLIAVYNGARLITEALHNFHMMKQDEQHGHNNLHGFQQG
jgi:hypothetical protein